MPEPVIGLNPKLLEEVQKELEKIKRGGRPPNAEQALIQNLETEMKDITKIVYSMRARERAELKEVLAQFKRFNEQIQRRLFGR